MSQHQTLFQKEINNLRKLKDFNKDKIKVKKKKPHEGGDSDEEFDLVKHF